MGKKDKVRCQGKCQILKAPNAHNFYKSKKEEYFEYQGYCPICKECINEVLIDEDEKVTISNFKEVLKLLDVVFVEKLFNQAITKSDGDSGKIFNNYRTLITFSKEYKDLCYGVIKDGESPTSKKTFNGVPQELIEFWGEGIKDPNDYYAYQKEYDFLCIQDGGEITGVKQSYFKQISVLSRKASVHLMRDNMTEYQKIISSLTTLCEKCGINPKQIQDKDDSNKGTYGTFIRMIEEEKPITDWTKMIGEVDVIKKIIQVFFFGHLAQVTEMRNPLQCEYDEVMKEYSVKVDDYDSISSIEEAELAQESVGRRFIKAVKVNGKWLKRK